MIIRFVRIVVNLQRNMLRLWGRFGTHFISNALAGTPPPPPIFEEENNNNKKDV